MNLFEATAKLAMDTSDFVKGIKNAQNSMNDSKKSLEQYRKDVMNLAQQYKNSGMDMSEATKKAYSEIDKSLYNLGKDADSNGTKIKSFGDIFSSLREKFSGVGNVTDQISGKFSVFGDVLKANIFSDVISKGFDMVVSGFERMGDVAKGFVENAVQVGMSFDSSMSQVAATMGMTTAEMEAQTATVGDFSGNLREFAEKMGAETAFSAVQAADALNYMALAGYDVEKSMNMLPNVLNLAAAGGMDLANASDMVTDAASALGLTTEQTTEMVDKMAMASSKSNTSVSQLGSAILTVGGTAKMMKDGTTELATVLGILADNGVKGSEGGTALRNMLLSLSAPTDEAKKQLDELGVSVFDSAGNMRNLNDIFLDMNSAFSSMTQQGRTEAISNIFNKRDLKSVEALLANVGDRYEELSGYIDNAAGSGEQMAKTQLDNLKGDVTIMKSAFEGLQIAISNKVTPALRTFAKFGGDALSRLTKAFKKNGLNAVSVVLPDIIADGIQAVTKEAPKAVKAVIKVLKIIGNSIAKNADLIADSFTSITKDVSAFFSKNVSSFTKSGMKIVKGIAKGVSQNQTVLLPAFTDAIVTVIEELSKPENVTDFIDTGIQFLSAIGEGLGESAGILIERVPDIIDNLKQGFSNNKDKIKGAGETILTAFSDDLKGFSFSDAVDNIVSGLSNALDSEEWKDVKEKISSGIQNIDFAEITSNLSKLIIGVTDATGKVVDGVDWDIIGGAIGEAMNGVDWFRILDSAFKLAVTTIKNAPELLDGLANTITFETANQIITIGGGAIIAKSLVTGMGAKLTSLLSAEAGGAVAGFFAGLPEVAIAALGGWTLGSVIVDALGVDTIIEANEWWLEYWYAGLDDTKKSLSQGWDNFKDAMYNIFVAPWKQAAEYFNDFVDDVKTGYGVIKEAFDWLEGKGEAIYDFMHPSGMSTKEVIIDTFLPDTVPAQEWGKDLNENMAKGIDDNSDKVEKSSASLAQKIRNFLGFSEPEEGALSDFHTFAPDMLQLFADGIKENEYLVTDKVAELGKNIKSNIQSTIDSAVLWGSDMIQNFISGIHQKWNDAVNTVSDFAGMIASFIGFSEPEKGALSRFHTFAPDMMKLFAQGMEENQNLVLSQAETLSNNLADAIQSPIRNPFQITVDSEIKFSTDDVNLPELPDLISNVRFLTEKQPDFQNQEYTVTFLDNLDEIIQKVNSISDKTLLLDSEYSVPEELPELSLTADTSTFDKIRELLENPLVVSVQLSDGLEKLNSMFADVRLASPEMNAVRPYTNDYIKQVEDIKNNYSTTNYYNNVENNSYASSRSYANESAGHYTTVQNMTISVPNWNVNSPADMDALADALIDRIADKLNAKAIQDNRGMGGIGWTM